MQEMKPSKQLFIVAALLLLSIPFHAQAQRSSRRLTIEKLVDQFEIAFEAHTLEKLDAKWRGHGKVRIVIEYQTIPNEVKVFRTYRGLERWLRSRETDSMPAEDGTVMKLPMRIAMRREGCRRGVCSYISDGGIDHNRLYIQRVSYGYRQGRPYIKSIRLLSG